MGDVTKHRKIQVLGIGKICLVQCILLISIKKRNRSQFSWCLPDSPKLDSLKLGLGLGLGFRVTGLGLGFRRIGTEPFSYISDLHFVTFAAYSV